MERPLIKLENLSKYYTSTQQVVVGLHNINLQFSRGEFVAITGESGSGKSTLSHVLGGILPYESGEFYLNGQPTSHYDGQNWEQYRRDNISFISQSYGILPGATVQGNVVTALRLSGMDKHTAKTESEQILKQVDLWQLRHRRAAKLSSGQKQRLSIARALAKPAPILIADEPTGNLDPENSQKIIELLSEAAKTRLVLLVTHEFAEAEDYATRHIILQDGRVVMDAPLREAHVPEREVVVPKGNKKPMSPYVSFLQQRSRPIWTALMTLFFSLTAFSVFAFLGAFIIALDDTNTRIYDPSIFANGDINRIVVTTLDQRPLTQEDYDAILNTPYVTTLEKNGYVTDVQYAYRDGLDYKTIYTEHATEYSTWVTETYQPYKTAPFMRTVPLLKDGAFNLLEGKLPEGFYEVVAHESEGYAIGEKIQVFIINQHYWGNYQFLNLNFTVVGITDYGSGLYFSTDMGRFCQQVARSDNGGSYYRMMIPEDQQATKERLMLQEGLTEEQAQQGYLTDDEFRCHSSQYSSLLTSGQKGGPQVKATFGNLNQVGEEIDFRFLHSVADIVLPTETGEGLRIIKHYTHDIQHVRIFQVSANTFDEMTYNFASEQVSITIEDYAYTQRVLDALGEKGYSAVSPYQQGSTRIDEEKAADRKQTLTVCLAALVAVAALQIVLLRAMFSVQTESYKLLSHIGLVSKTAKRSVFWQILSFIVLGQLVGGGAIWLCGRAGIERIAHILRYLPAQYIGILSLVHLAVCLGAAIWVITALGKQVYPLAARFTDLHLEEEEATA
ncbi:MAG: ABC transporter ATP-binding protein [Oscillospiraceae bacterium]|nr:ABC transporter ATP-binding protein [Oscillospiraceae bacterium]